MSLELLTSLADKAPATIMIAGSIQLLSKLLGRPLEETAELAADVVKGWRYRLQAHNYNKLMETTQKKLDKEGITPQPIPAKTLFSLLDTATLEEDPILQDMWSSLLVNAADPKTASSINVTFIELVKQLSPQEAKILEMIYSDEIYKIMERHPKWINDWIPKKAILYLLENPDDYELVISNLERLKLIKVEAVMDVDGIPVTQAFDRTLSGERLMKACQRAKIISK
jgi:Abortive infection alpha